MVAKNEQYLFPKLSQNDENFPNAKGPGHIPEMVKKHCQVDKKLIWPNHHYNNAHDSAEYNVKSRVTLQDWVEKENHT